MKKWEDQLRIVRHLNIQRTINGILLAVSFLISRLTKKNFHIGQPFSLSIEPTTACNLSCPECPSGLKQFTRATGKMDLTLHRTILDQIQVKTFYINYYFQGEPFLHPHFLDLIKEAKSRKIYTATSTNGHFITEKKAQEIVASGLDRLILSVDGFTQETYESYRIDGELEKVLKAAKELVKAKKSVNSTTPYLIFQTLAFRANEHELDKLADLSREIGMNEFRIKTAQFYDYEKGNDLMPVNEKYARYKQRKDGTYILKWKTGNHCWRMWSSSVVTVDGKLVPCCFDKDAKYQLGTLKEQSFEAIWKSPQYNGFRTAILTQRNSIDICQNCSEGSKVWA